MKDALILINFLILGLFLGFLLGFTFDETKNAVIKVQGLYIKDKTLSETKNLTNEYSGDWVCVNTDGISYNRALQVFNHEVGHEIFAEQCEKNITKCLDVMNEK